MGNKVKDHLKALDPKIYVKIANTDGKVLVSGTVKSLFDHLLLSLLNSEVAIFKRETKTRATVVIKNEV